MKVSIKQVLLINDYGCSNYHTDFESFAIFEDTSVLKELLIKALAPYFIDWCYDDFESEEYVDTCYNELMTNRRYHDIEAEIIFKLEECKYYA